MIIDDGRLGKVMALPLEVQYILYLLIIKSISIKRIANLPLVFRNHLIKINNTRYKKKHSAMFCFSCYFLIVDVIIQYLIIKKKNETLK